jgi:hypothetical protein
MNRKADFNDEAFTTITKSRLGESPTRERTQIGQYGLQEMGERAHILQQTLGRLPTNEELMLDMPGALGSSWAEEEGENPGSIGACNQM